MATSSEFIEYVCSQIAGCGDIRYRKMFGEYMVYVNDKPVFLVCDNTVYVKVHESLKREMEDFSLGVPYEGAKQHYILDIDDSDLSKKTALLLEEITPLPKPKKKKTLI
ncbi:hypothetical protein SDC9_182682 [bioreactor metagenome]|uniref:TfoX N-terminal domain-containing protein n=1 Tax=bioreactor metagenome TaxID=1076179 RepID=A0A645H873_9ZZZZ|nr:TfoX/Sxy family protein [Lachnospiraceae bacterium]